MSDLLKVKVGGSDYLCKWEEPNTVEIGGKTYKTVKIGSQIWLAENLDLIWDGLTIGGSATTSQQARYYNNDEATYGYLARKCNLLYNGAAVDYLNSNRATLIPGWHVPSEAEWNTLISVGTSTQLKAANVSWAFSWNGTDDFGFNLLPCGRSGSTWYGIGTAAYCITTSKNGARNWAKVFTTNASVSRDDLSGNQGGCIRLVKDAT